MRRELVDLFPAVKNKIGGKDLIYLDSACTSLKNRPAAELEKKMLLEAGFCAGKRSVNPASALAQDFYEEARIKTAGFLNACPEEVVFVSGSTEAFNILASSMNFSAGDEIFISALEHNSVFLPFLRVAREKKLKIRIIPLKCWQPDIEFFEKNISSRAKLLCITAASNLTGGMQDLSRFSALARKYKTKVLVDAAQYAATHEIDVKKIGADFLAFSGHKLTAPFGTGILWIKKDNFKILNSSKLGGGTAKKIYKDRKSLKADLLEGFYSFEAGIQNYSGSCALAETLSLLRSEGMERIRKRVSDLARMAQSGLSEINSVRIIGEGLEKGSLVSFVPISRNFSIADFQLYMSSLPGGRVFAFRAGRMCADLACMELGIKGAVRISFNFYNDEKDVEFFIRGLKAYLAAVEI